VHDAVDAMVVVDRRPLGGLEGVERARSEVEHLAAVVPGQAAGEFMVERAERLFSSIPQSAWSSSTLWGPAATFAPSVLFVR
jgi:hypothetical protein